MRCSAVATKTERACATYQSELFLSQVSFNIYKSDFFSPLSYHYQIVKRNDERDNVRNRTKLSCAYGNYTYADIMNRTPANETTKAKWLTGWCVCAQID